MERDDQLNGVGNSYSTFFRGYDARLGRWMSIDPKSVPWASPMSAMSNNPITHIDPLGDTTWLYTTKGKFLERIDDKMTNQVHFIDKQAYSDHKDWYATSQARAYMFRDHSEFYVGEKIATLFEEKMKWTLDNNKETGGFLYKDNGSKELKLWECARCPKERGQVTFRPIYFDFDFKLDDIRMYWHTHPEDEYPANEFSPSGGDYEFGLKLNEYGIDNASAGPSILMTRNGMLFFRAEGYIQNENGDKELFLMNPDAFQENSANGEWLILDTDRLKVNDE